MAIFWLLGAVIFIAISAAVAAISCKAGTEPGFSHRLIGEADSFTVFYASIRLPFSK